jgi:hypothetical protein
MYICNACPLRLALRWRMAYLCSSSAIEACRRDACMRPDTPRLGFLMQRRERPMAHTRACQLVRAASMPRMSRCCCAPRCQSHDGAEASRLAHRSWWCHCCSSVRLLFVFGLRVFWWGFFVALPTSRCTVVLLEYLNNAGVWLKNNVRPNRCVLVLPKGPAHLLIFRNPVRFRFSGVLKNALGGICLCSPEAAEVAEVAEVE